MRQLITTIALALAFIPVAHARETVGEEAREVKAEAVQAKRAAGKDIRHAGSEIKKSGRNAGQAVITRCADGRHTVKGASGCAGHGGVRDPK